MQQRLFKNWNKNELLGIEEGNGIKHAAMKEMIRKEYYRRINMILKSELNSLNKITAINTLAI